MNGKNFRSHFLLLQVNDSLFPIGGYSHSYGLETYIQNGRIHDSATAEEYIRRRLRYNFLYTDLLAVRLAYEAARDQRPEKLTELEEIMEASRIPSEIRDASRRLGSRFVKTLSKMNLPLNSGFLREYLDGSQAVLVDLNRDVPAQLAFAIEMLRDHPDLRAEMGRAGAKTAKRFSVETYYNNLVRILADLGERV